MDFNMGLFDIVEDDNTPASNVTNSETIFALQQEEEILENMDRPLMLQDKEEVLGKATGQSGLSSRSIFMFHQAKGLVRGLNTYMTQVVVHLSAKIIFPADN